MWLWWKVNGSIFLDKNAYIKELNFFLYPFTSPLFVFMPTLPFVNLTGKYGIIFAVVLAQLACIWRFTYDVMCRSSSLMLPKQSSLHLNFFFLVLLTQQNYGIAFILRCKLQDIRAFALTCALFFQRYQWEFSSRTARKARALQHQRNVWAMSHCLIFIGSVSLHEWVPLPLKACQCSLFLPSTGGWYCPHIFVKQLGDKIHCIFGMSL